MLQQTTVATVRPKFAAFTERWPDFAAFAAADDAEIMAAWAGLGYYARARNLIACARAIVADHGGRLPDTEARSEEHTSELQSLMRISYAVFCLKKTTIQN